MIYDITSKKSSLETLEDLTEVRKEYWEYYSYECHDLGKDIDEVLQEVKTNFKVNTKINLNEITFVCLHVTTSNNGCKDILKYGLTDLKKVYASQETELRYFLDKHNIYINLENETIEISGKKESIHFYLPLPFDISDKNKNLWLIGRKFYYDFCVCGFLSIKSKHPYGGNVHLRPEIIMNISKLCKIDLERSWQESHSCHLVKFKVPYVNLANLSSESDSEETIRESLLFKAFWNTMYESEEIILLKNNISISSKDIINAYKFEFY
jgi:hypothetical protein